MKRLTFDPSRYQTTTQKTEEWKEVAKELTAYFKKPCYWIPWKYEMWKIRQAFKVAQENGKDFRYFLGILKKNI